MREEMSPREFVTAVQDYFGGRYTTAQADAVSDWLIGRSPQVLALVYQTLLRRETARYKTPPALRELNAALHEVMEAYPEHRPESIAAQADEDRLAITDDAGWTEEELEENLQRFRTIAGRVAQGKNVGRDA